ncbi:hypothetical protein PAHAL_7G284400 [Panicum hallii]|uniref:Uncharacterized protein n=1 Tax=Panicum hallii TaxID=206008 RepID=A0A2S3IA65_9POAL|nr:hypothetical protein PAHAL_7G284400 [Panicum hallii]
MASRPAALSMEDRTPLDLTSRRRGMHDWAPGCMWRCLRDATETPILLTAACDGPVCGEQIDHTTDAAAASGTSIDRSPGANRLQ